MNRTRLSLFYLVGYLIPAGVALLLGPQLALKLLFSTGSYGDVMPRFVGLFVLVLGILALQIVRHRLAVLYTTVLGVRGLMLLVMLALYFYSRDPLFISLLVVVGLGVVLTSISLWLDRQGAASARLNLP
jgi:hypothetical protein